MEAKFKLGHYRQSGSESFSPVRSKLWSRRCRWKPGTPFAMLATPVR